MIKLNCWEIKECGREPNGKHAANLGICPVTTDISSNGINGGKNAGRICWDIPHTLCEGKVHDNFSQKAFSCVSCDVFNRVRAEEGAVNFSLLKIFHIGRPIHMIDDAEVESDVVVRLPSELNISRSAGESVKYRKTDL